MAETENRKGSGFIILVLGFIIIILISCCLISYLGKGAVRDISESYTSDSISVFPGSSEFMPEGYNDLYIGMPVRDIEDRVMLEGDDLFLRKNHDRVIETKLFFIDSLNKLLVRLKLIPGARVVMFRFHYKQNYDFETLTGKWDKGPYKFKTKAGEREIELYRTSHYPEIVLILDSERKMFYIGYFSYYFRNNEVI